MPFQYVMIALGFAALSYGIYGVVTRPAGYDWLFLVLLTLVSSSFAVKIPATNSKISIGDTIYLTNMIMFGVPCGIITAAVDAMLSSMRMKTRARRLQYLLFNT